MRKLKKNEYAKYYKPYIDLVPEGELLSILESSHQETQAFFLSVGEINGNYRYAEGKWSLKEVLIHLIDTEQIMATRALRIARKDKTPLPGFEQNDYVDNVNVDLRTIADLMEEYTAMRKLTIIMFKYFTEEMLNETGTASGNPVSVLALAYIIIGHEIHHREFIRARYL